MKSDKVRRSAVLATAIMFGGAWPVFSVRASQGSGSQGAPSTWSRSATAVSLGDPARTIVNGVLYKDARLAVKVTLQKQDVEMGGALDRLGGLGHVKLTNSLSRPGRVSFSYHATPLRDILDSLATVCGAEWRRGPGSSLVLTYPYDPHGLDGYRPHTQAEADLDQAGRPLPGELRQLPPDALQALERGQDLDSPNAPPPGLPFGDLPPAMQETLRQMQQAELNVMAQGQLASFPDSLKTFQGNDITKDRVILRRDNDSQFTRYNVTFIMPPMTVGGLTYSTSGGYTVTATVFKDPRDQNHGIAPAEPAPPSDAAQAQADAASRSAALATDPALKQRVSLTTDLASLSDALTALSAKTGLAFAAQEQDGLHSVAYKDVPVSDVLDGLAARYTTDALRCTWGVRPGGVVVFHYGLTAQGREAMQAKLEAMMPQLQAGLAQAAAERAAKSQPGGSGGQ